VTYPMLEGVDWSAVLQALEARYPDQHEAVLWAVPRSTLLRPTTCALAVLAVQAGERALEQVVGQPVARWLYWTARVALRLVHDEPPVRLRVPGRAVPLSVGPGLFGLPLLGLAAQHAARADHPIVVRSAYLGPLSDGRCTPNVIIDFIGETAMGSLLEVSRQASDLVRVFLHELSHEIDPVKRPPEQSERFADALGGLLARRPPRDLDALDALIAEVDEMLAAERPRTVAISTAPEVSEADTSGLPAPDMASLLAFITLPLRIDELSAA
jgi:hypothetical protein